MPCIDRLPWLDPGNPGGFFFLTFFGRGFFGPVGRLDSLEAQGLATEPHVDNLNHTTLEAVRLRPQADAYSFRLR